MEELLRTAFWVVTRESQGIVRVVRTPQPFASIEEMQRSMDELNARLDGLERSAHRLLVDTREATGRNDPEFETAFAPQRQRLMSGFQRRAVLVRSVSGQLQVQRHAKADGVDVGAFQEEREATEFLVS